MEAREKDYVMRQIRQLVQAILRIVANARAGGAVESHVDALRRAAEGALGVDYRLLSRLEPGSLPMLVGDGESMRTLAWITGQEAELHEAADDTAAAHRLRLRALALFAECATRFSAEAPACRTAARELIARVRPPGVEERHAKWLEEGDA